MSSYVPHTEQDRITADYIAPNGVRVVGVRLLGDHREYTVRITKSKTTTVYQGSNRVTKRDAASLYYRVLGVVYTADDVKRQAETAYVDQPETHMVSAGLVVQLNLNTTGKWDEEKLIDFVRDQIEGALAGIETMVPNAALGRPATIMTVDVHSSFTGWDASGV